MCGIAGYGHVALRVTDTEASLAFYRDKLGFPEMLRLHKDDGSDWLIYLRISDQQYLELIPGALEDHAPGWNANGVNHICLTCDDLGATLVQIAGQGIKLTAQAKLGIDGNRQAWIEDPDGNRIELMEMHPDCLQFEAIERLKARVV